LTRTALAVGRTGTAGSVDAGLSSAALAVLRTGSAFATDTGLSRSALQIVGTRRAHAANAEVGVALGGSRARFADAGDASLTRTALAAGRTGAADSVEASLAGAALAVGCTDGAQPRERVANLAVGALAGVGARCADGRRVAANLARYRRAVRVGCAGCADA
jgi:hypothetical protein